MVSFSEFFLTTKLVESLNQQTQRSLSHSTSLYWTQGNCVFLPQLFFEQPHRESFQYGDFMILFLWHSCLFLIGFSARCCLCALCLAVDLILTLVMEELLPVHVLSRARATFSWALVTNGRFKACFGRKSHFLLGTGNEDGATPPIYKRLT